MRLLQHIIAAIIICTWIAFIVFLGWMLEQSMSNNIVEITPDANARSFTLRVVDDQGHGASGVGWGSGSVLTAAHVIQGGLSDYRVRQGDREWKIWGSRYIADRDAVILYVLGDGPVPRPDRRAAPMILGESVLVSGHPWSGPMQVSHGVVTGSNKWEVYRFNMDADISYGSSGGPVFDSAGRLIAIVVGMTASPSGPSFSIALPISEVLSGLERPNTGRAASIMGGGRGSRDGLHRPRYPAVQE